jgi:hypothetical protein
LRDDRGGLTRGHVRSGEIDKDVIALTHELKLPGGRNATLKALLARCQAALAEHQAALSASEEARRRLESIISDLRREKFSSKSEKLTPDQYNLPIEDVEIAQGVLDAAQEKAEAVISGKSERADRPRTSNRGQLPAPLPRVERLIEPGSTMCPCGCGPMTMIGEDLRASRCDPGAVPSAGDPSPEICVPSLLRCRGAGACLNRARPGSVAGGGQ